MKSNEETIPNGQHHLFSLISKNKKVRLKKVAEYSKYCRKVRSSIYYKVSDFRKGNVKILVETLRN